MMKRHLLLLALGMAITVPASAQFALHNGDRVVFYGDSITDQRLYTLYTEAYIRTRFPNLDVTFVHSGWGGDTVYGGGGGDIDTRLNRDVFSYKPTMVTIMLGMNDAGYRPLDEGLFDRYRKGYTHIVDRLTKEAPGVRLTLIEPSPFDDVTRPVSFPGGYNAVLLKYSDFVSELARQNRARVSDFNAPVVQMLTAANAKDPAAAQKIIQDRVHPGDAGHLVMAEALLRTWNAPAIVTDVSVDASGRATAKNTVITGLRASTGGATWTQKDDGLPFPLNLEDPLTKLVIDSSDFMQMLDRQPLKVTGLASGNYVVTIDEKAIGTFTAQQLNDGVDLASLPTPMRDQAMRVFQLVRERGEVHNQRWRSIQTHWALGPEKAASKEKEDVLKAFDRYDAALDAEVRRAAQPVPHQYAVRVAP